MSLGKRMERLRQAWDVPLPGHDAFLTLSGYPRPNLERARAMVPPPRESAVLILLYPRAQELYTLLMRRPTYAGVHSGQISFPGGKREPQDPDLEGTALREFMEETGALGTQVDMLGPLSAVYIPPSHLLVTPFVATTDALGPLAPDATEVAELIEAPVELLMREDILKRGRQPLYTGEQTLEVPYFDVLGNSVWGATALMLAELRELLRLHG